MARARNIKPSFFKNEILGTEDPLLGLLFISLWTLSDKSGRLEDRPLRIKAETFPYRENIDINGYLTQLEQLGFIERYEVSEQKIISVLKFEEHQSPHSTEKPSQLPAKPINTPLTVKKPLNNESTNVVSNINVLIPDSLIPDSLIPDSLIPDSLIPDTKTKPSAKARNSDDESFLLSLERAGVSLQVARDWMKVRKVKRLASTETALKVFYDECAKAGMSVPDAVTLCCGRGWGGLSADWLKPKSQASPSYQTPNEKAKQWADKATGKTKNEPYRTVIDIN